MGTRQTETKITALYERLSRDDDKLKVHIAESLSVRHQQMVSIFLFKRPNEFIVNCDDLFLPVAKAAHARSFINRDAVN